MTTQTLFILDSKHMVAHRSSPDPFTRKPQMPCNVTDDLPANHALYAFVPDGYTLCSFCFWCVHCEGKGKTLQPVRRQRNDGYPKGRMMIELACPVCLGTKAALKGWV